MSEQDSVPGSLLGVLEIGEEEIAEVVRVLRRKTMFRFLHDEATSESAQLERWYREQVGTDYALALGGGGTGALICALVGLGIGSGDEVIVPGYTYIATAAACLMVGAIPVLAEIDASLTLDPADVEAKIGPHTRAVIPVHMRGTPARMDAIRAIADRKGIQVLEDCAQANGASYQGRPVGSWGHAGAFSLQHYKVVTAGEAGVVTTSDPEVYRRAAIRHDSAMQFWREDADWPSFAGENMRLDELRAALALVQVRRIGGILSVCRSIKARLREGVRDLPGVRLQELPCAEGDCGITFAFFLPDPATARTFSEKLEARGVPTATIYNKRIPDRHIYTAWDYVLGQKTHDPSGWPWTAARRPIAYDRDMLPRTLDLLGRCLAIGINQQWRPHHADRVVEAIRSVHEELGLG